MADKLAGNDPRAPWLLLPEYVLHWLGARRVAEYTNATHTGLVDLTTHDWSPALLQKTTLACPSSAAAPIVPAGSVIGKLSGPLAQLPEYADTTLIAPACHDLASAVAFNRHSQIFRIPPTSISSTWSLVGTVVEAPVTSHRRPAMMDSPCSRRRGFRANMLLPRYNVNGMC